MRNGICDKSRLGNDFKMKIIILRVFKQFAEKLQLVMQFIYFVTQKRTF